MKETHGKYVYGMKTGYAKEAMSRNVKELLTV